MNNFIHAGKVKKFCAIYFARLDENCNIFETLKSKLTFHNFYLLFLEWLLLRKSRPLEDNASFLQQFFLFQRWAAGTFRRFLRLNGSVWDGQIKILLNTSIVCTLHTSSLHLNAGLGGLAGLSKFNEIFASIH